MRFIFKVIVRIVGVLGSLYFMYWLGIKGIIGTFIGVFVVVMLLANQNPMLLFVVEKLGGSKSYNDMLFDNDKDGYVEIKTENAKE